jgi:hypothetical protein
LYDESFVNGVQPIFVELFKNCSNEKAGIIEACVLYAICKLLAASFSITSLFYRLHKFGKLQYGDKLPSFFQKWSLHDVALLGSRLLEIAFDCFSKTQLTDHPQIIYHRQAGK